MSVKSPGSEPIYKRLYAFREMVADLLLVLLEFQSKDDRTMALRVLEYTAMLYREMLRERRLADGFLPPVLPVVLYNGDAPWRSASNMRELVAPTGPALARFQPSQCHIVLDERRIASDDPRLQELTKAVVLVEQSRSPQDLLRVVGLLLQALGTGSEELKQAFADWLSVLSRRLAGVSQTRPATLPSLREVKMTLEERVAEWHKPYIEQGREEGREEGISLGREEGMRLAREARQEAIDQQRQMLRRQVAVRFGGEVADRVGRVLATESNPERLAEAGEAVARCATGDQLLATLQDPR